MIAEVKFQSQEDELDKMEQDAIEQNDPDKFWRISKFKLLSSSNTSLLSERRQMFVLLGKWLLGATTVIPLAMFQWKYPVWAVLFVVSCVGLAVWDYVFHIKHVRFVKRELRAIAREDDDFEQNFILGKPDRLDLIAPYVLFVVFYGMIVGGYTTMMSYNERFGDSAVMNTILSSKSGVKSNTVLLGTE